MPKYFRNVVRLSDDVSGKNPRIVIPVSFKVFEEVEKFR